MKLAFRKLHPLFAAEMSGLDLRQVHDRETLDAIRGGLDEYAVLVFRDQPFTDAEQTAFTQRFDGAPAATTRTILMTGESQSAVVVDPVDAANEYGRAAQR